MSASQLVTEVRRPIVVAFPGGYLSPADLRRDMGHPTWVDHYLDTTAPDAALRLLRQFHSVVLIGYSLGGSLIGHLSQTLLNIAAAVLYESALIGTDSVGGKFPVLWIRNRYTASRRREREFANTRETWRNGRDLYEMTGHGRHINWRWGWPPFAHAWDQEINPFIEQWFVNRCTPLILPR